MIDHTITKDIEHGVGFNTPTELTFAAIGVAAVIWCGRFVSGRLKRDEIEKVELAAAVKRSDVRFEELSTVVSGLQVKVIECETHRSHDGATLKRLESELQEVRTTQTERLKRETP